MPTSSPRTTSSSAHTLTTCELGLHAEALSACPSANCRAPSERMSAFCLTTALGRGMAPGRLPALGPLSSCLSAICVQMVHMDRCARVGLDPPRLLINDTTTDAQDSQHGRRGRAEPEALSQQVNGHYAIARSLPPPFAHTSRPRRTFQFYAALLGLPSAPLLYP